MRQYSLTHLSDAALLKDLGTLVAQDRATTASLLAHIAEVDARKLYLPAGYPSMHAYCVDELRLSEDAAFKRIRAGRAARDFPALFDAVARGDLNLAAVNVLAPYLTQGNAAELIATATGKRRLEIEALLAARFPRSEFLAIGEVVRLNETPVQLAPGPVGAHVQLAPGRVGAGNSLSANAPIFETAVRDAHAHAAARPRVTPVAAERYLLHVPIDRATHEKLEHAVALLSHSIPSGDVAQVLDRALDVLVAKLERRKCAKTDRPARADRPRRHSSRASNSRHVPAHIRRAVWERDRGQCTFVGDTGHRCAARTRLEFDHVVPVARGGQTSVETIRLRCRAHNQYEAERTFGAGFMRARREGARERAAEERARRERAARDSAIRESAARESAAASNADAAAQAADAARRRDVCA